MKETLEGVELLRELRPEELAALAKRCTWRRFAAKQEIVGYQDDTRDVIFVIEGRVRVVIYSISGKEVSFRDIETGSYFGEFSAIDGKPRSASVVALSKTLVAFMPAGVYWDVLREHPSVAAALLRQLTGLLRLYSERVFEFSTLAVNNRIHAELLRLARDHANGGNEATIAPAPTHAEIASRVSTSREAVTREFNNLARNGLIEQHGRELRVLDLEQLDRMVEEVLGE